MSKLGKLKNTFWETFIYYKVMLVLSLQGHNTIRHSNLSQTIVKIK